MYLSLVIITNGQVFIEYSICETNLFITITITKREQPLDSPFKSPYVHKLKRIQRFTTLDIQSRHTLLIQPRTTEPGLGMGPDWKSFADGELVIDTRSITNAS